MDIVIFVADLRLDRLDAVALLSEAEHHIGVSSGRSDADRDCQ